jgi:phospholipid/cholesterol/gamma-HCH transport system ATP-binding protein
MKQGISFRGVGVRFGTQDILRDLAFDLSPGETVAIVGPSGCGKTVTLKLLVGLLSATHGSVHVDGRDVSAMNSRDLSEHRRRVGFLFQGAALFDSLNVFDNVAFGPRAQGRVPEGEIAGIVKQRLLEVGLPENTAQKMPSELSGGMKKRVGLARALALDPEVMLYDEPTTGLDPMMIGTINDLIRQTRERRPVTSILVTHEMRTVREVAQRVIMLENLREIAANDPQIVYDGSTTGLDDCPDERVRCFVRGQPRSAA